MTDFYQLLEQLSYEKSILSDDILVATISSVPFDVKILFYKEGTVVPRHTHSTNTQHILLSGKIEVFLYGEKESRILEPLQDYNCGRFEYQFTALADTYIMLIQEQGTTVIKSNS